MEIQYAKNDQFAFVLNKTYRRILSSGLKQRINFLKKSIESIENNPKNDGQVKYTIKIDQRWREIEQIKKDIEYLK